jgi:hypothetical protein
MNEVKIILNKLYDFIILLCRCAFTVVKLQDSDFSRKRKNESLLKFHSLKRISRRPVTRQALGLTETQPVSLSARNPFSDN